MTIFVQLLTITYLCVLAIAVGAKAKMKYGLSFSAFCFGLVIWTFSNIGFSQNFDTIFGLVFARGAFTSMVIVMMSLQKFAFVFPLQVKVSSFIKRFFTIFHIFVFFASILPWIVTRVEWVNGVLNPVYGPLYSVFIIYILFSLASIFFIFAHKYKDAVKLDRLQLKYFVTGLALTASYMLVTNLVLPALAGSSYTSQFGPLGVIFFLSFLSMAILRQRLFDLKLIIGRGIIYFTYGSILFGLFYGLNWFYERFTGGIYSPLSMSLGVVVAIFIAVSLVKIYTRLESWVLGELFHTNYDLYKISKNFVEKINSMLSMDDLCTEIINGFNRIFSSKRAGIVVLGRDDKSILFEKFINFRYKDFNTEPLLLALELWKGKDHGPILIKEDLREEYEETFSDMLEELLTYMDKYKISAILPLNRKVALNGIFIIGDKASMEPFTVEDVNLMETLIGYSSVAIGRALLYDQASKFNKILAREVKNATKELELANIELQKLDQMKDDLISIASHELRTPASIVKGKLHLLKGKVEKLRGCKEYDPKIESDIDVCLSAIEREIEQVNTLLEASRVGKDTMVLEKQDYDITTIVSSAVSDFKEMAKAAGLKLSMEEAKDKVPLLNIDVRRIREVMDNLITNAVKYTEEGEIILSVFTRDKGRSVCVSVKDTGIGIPKDEVGNLFSKFYRVQNKEKRVSHLVRPGGTGLGLYVAKNIVEKHGGEIWVESKVGKGSTFTFCLPVST